MTVNRVKRDRQGRRFSTVNVVHEPFAQNEHVHLSPLTKMNNQLTLANAAGKKRKDKILDHMIDIVKNDPDIGVSEIARQIGRSRTTVYKYLEEIEQSGRMGKNSSDGKITVS